MTRNCGLRKSPGNLHTSWHATNNSNLAHNLVCRPTQGCALTHTTLCADAHNLVRRRTTMHKVWHKHREGGGDRAQCSIVAAAFLEDGFQQIAAAPASPASPTDRAGGRAGGIEPTRSTRLRHTVVRMLERPNRVLEGAFEQKHAAGGRAWASGRAGGNATGNADWAAIPVAKLRIAGAQ